MIALAALAIKLEDRGPVFSAQTRIGWHRVPFRLMKLRTMRDSSGTGDLYTRPGDARITRVGRMLRAARLDELPQLWNVLVGQMSLIGPRAEWDRLVRDYERAIPELSFPAHGQTRHHRMGAGELPGYGTGVERHLEKA